MAPRMPKGSAMSAVGSGAMPTPSACRPQVTRMTSMVPKAIMSPWAKFEKRSTA